MSAWPTFDQEVCEELVPDVLQEGEEVIEGGLRDAESILIDGYVPNELWIAYGFWWFPGVLWRATLVK